MDDSQSTLRSRDLLEILERWTGVKPVASDSAEIKCLPAGCGGALFVRGRSSEKQQKKPPTRRPAAECCGQISENIGGIRLHRENISNRGGDAINDVKLAE